MKKLILMMSFLLALGLPCLHAQIIFVQQTTGQSPEIGINCTKYSKIKNKIQMAVGHLPCP